MLWKIVTLFFGVICLIYYAVICIVLKKWDSTFSRFWLAAGCFCIFIFCVVREKMIQCVLISAILISVVLFVLTEVLIIGTICFEKERKYRYLIVLGAQVRGTRVTDSLRRRLEKAAMYAKKYPETILIVSGGQGKGEEISEADAMEAYLLEKGISEDRILKESRSKTTEQNLKFSQPIVKDMGAEVAIVSNDFHLYRACCYAKRLGYRNVYPLTAHTHPVLFVNYLVRECLAVWRMWMQI